MHFDWLNWLNCMIEALILLLIWRLADTHSFEKWNYLLTYVLLCAISIPVTFVDSVFFSLLPVNFVLIFLSMWGGFRRGFIQTLLHTVFQYLLLLYLQCVINSLVPAELFMTMAGNFIANGTVLTVTVLLLIISRHFHFEEILERHAKTVWTLLLILFLPEIIVAQVFVSYKYSFSSLIGVVLVLIQFLYLATVTLWFLLIQRRHERRQFANTEKYINEMNTHLEQSRRSIHDFNKHIRYLRNTVALNVEDSRIVQDVDEYCDTMLSVYEKEEVLLQLDNPVLRAILYGRQSQALEQHIEYILDATPVLPVFPLKNYQIVEVLDNLINNAFECVTELPEDARWLRIKLSLTPHTDNGSEHMLCIENPAPTVDMDAIINDKSYSGTHHGIGLQHVSKLVSDTGGKLIIHHMNGIFTAKVLYTHNT